MKKLDPKSKNRWGLIFVFVWAIGTSLVLSYLMAEHLFSQAPPMALSGLLDLKAQIQQKSPKLKTLVHVIYQHCSCTQSLLKHLVQREVTPENNELILFIGEHNPYEFDLQKRGYLVHNVSRSEALQKFDIKAAPALIIFNEQNDTPLYLGGYYKNSSLKNPEETDILLKIKNKEQVVAYPIYGCSLHLKIREWVN